MVQSCACCLLTIKPPRHIRHEKTGTSSHNLVQKISGPLFVKMRKMSLKSLSFKLVWTKGNHMSSCKILQNTKSALFYTY